MSNAVPPLKEVFGKALECASQAERERYLAEACGGDGQLRAEVESLLKADTDAGSFLAHPAADVGTAAQQARECGPAGDAATQAGAKPEEVSLDFLAPAQKAGSLGRLGHYEVLEVIGKGGMGIVLKAFDEKLHRVVAIKTMLPQLATSANARQRFTREAQAAAAIRNEHVIDIHAVEEAAGLPYLVMEYISGVSLQERLDRSRLKLNEILRIGMQTARGLAAAHAQGLVHRDVKPANILLENGVERVKITDFGLARTVDDASLTQSGVIAGTPQYMAPEQARGEHVDHRADLFGLGSLLYVMCTGRPPFRAENTMAVLKRVCEDTPHSIRELNPEVPEWLAATITRLHAKDPAERFQSAAEVAQYLENGLAHLHQPSAAPAPAVVVGRTAGRPRSLRRRWMMASVAVLLVAGSLVALPHILDWMRGEDGQGQNGRASPPESSLQVRLRATLKGHTSTVNTLAFDRDGKILASGGGQGDHTVKLWDLVTEKEFAALEGHTGGINCVNFAPDGKTLATASWDGTVKLWQTSTVKQLANFPRGPEVWHVAFSPDGQTLAAAGWNPSVRMRNVDTDQDWEGVELGGGARALAFSPDGKTLAVILGFAPGKFVQLLDVEKRTCRAVLDGHIGGASCVAFSPDGKLLATGSGNDRTVKLWDAATGAELATLRGHTMPLESVAISHDGRTLASGGGLWNRRELPGELKLWDVTTRELLALPPHPSCVHAVAFSPRDNILATACADGSIRIWDVIRGK